MPRVVRRSGRRLTSVDSVFAPPRTYASPAFVKDGNGRDLIPFTAAEVRRLFNRHVHGTLTASTAAGHNGDAAGRPQPANPLRPKTPGSQNAFTAYFIDVGD